MSKSPSGENLSLRLIEGVLGVFEPLGVLDLVVAAGAVLGRLVGHLLAQQLRRDQRLGEDVK